MYSKKSGQNYLVKHNSKYNFRYFENAEEYVHNPINAFHLLARNAIWLPKIFKNNTFYNKLFSNASRTIQQAAFGIVDIQEFYNMNTTDITNGILKVNDVIENRSQNKFSLDEILLIADAAGKSQYFDRKVEWLYSALSLAKTEHDQKLIKIKIQKSKDIHDKVFEVISEVKYSPGNFQVFKLVYWTRNVPFNSRSKLLKKLQKKRADRLLNFENNFDNLIYTTKSKNWLGHDLMLHMKINYRKQTQQLCANKVKKIKYLCSERK